MAFSSKMLDFCLEPGKIEALIMLDLQTKSTMKLVCGRVSVQATSRASRIPDFTNIAEFFPHFSNM